ncbi:MAG: hypothetical protein ACKOCU_00315 [Betaproteobacteria bacterium]
MSIPVELPSLAHGYIWFANGFIGAAMAGWMICIILLARGPEHRGRPLLDGQPLHLLCRPQHTETGWWNGPATARDHFVAATLERRLVWIFRTRLTSPEEALGWALQGWFA